MKYSSKSDVGKVRELNEDRCTVFYPDGDTCIGIVCDGMGGANHGEVASQVAIETAMEKIKLGWREGIPQKSIINLLNASISAANTAVYDMAASKRIYSGMGTTVVSCVVTDGAAIFAHAGDSRGYVYSESLQQVTKDHSYVQMLVDRNQLTKEEAQNHPMNNLITRAIGISEDIAIDINTVSVKAGDLILLCSDGLSNFVPESDISEILERYRENAADELVNKANENGGEDNISAVVILCE